MTTFTLTESDLRAAVERELPGVRADLERLVRIPGIAFDGFVSDLPFDFSLNAVVSSSVSVQVSGFPTLTAKA